MGIISVICAIISILLSISSLLGLTKIENNIKKQIKMNQEKLKKSIELNDRIDYLIKRLKFIDDIIKDDFVLQIVSSGGAVVSFENSYLPQDSLEFIHKYRENIKGEIEYLKEEFDRI